MGGGASSALFPGKEPPHKEYLGSDPNWGDLGGMSLCVCAVFALDFGVSARIRQFQANLALPCSHIRDFLFRCRQTKIRHFQAKYCMFRH